MNIRIIKSTLIKLLGGNFTSFMQALRFVYLNKTRGITDPEGLLLSKFLGAGDVAIDVGANGANWTKWLSDSVGKKGRVYAFEADPYYAKSTKLATRWLSLKNVIFFCFGLSDISRSAHLQITDNEGQRFSGMSAINLSKSENTPNGCTEIELRRLDDLTLEYPEISKVSLIKCDVEGHELMVFKGAQELISKSRPVVILEVGRFHEQGYAAEDLYNFFDDLEYDAFAIVKSGVIEPVGPSLALDHSLSVNRILIPREALDKMNSVLSNGIKDYPRFMA